MFVHLYCIWVFCCVFVFSVLYGELVTYACASKKPFLLDKRNLVKSSQIAAIQSSITLWRVGTTWKLRWSWPSCARGVPVSGKGNFCTENCWVDGKDNF